MDPRPPSPTSPTHAQAPGSIKPGAEDLWSSILDGVSSVRGVVTKNVIILGSNKTGKSTLISRLASPTGDAPHTDEEVANGAGGADVLDLGLSYSSLDVGDEADEETVARLGIYQLPSPLPPYPSLLPLALSRSTLLDSLIIIVLDWERPWQFLRDLKAWMGVLDGVLKERGVGAGWEGAEGRERLEAHLRHYFEPPLGATGTTGLSASQLADTETSLPPGVLTDNLGLPIVIVCTKINALERDKDFKEEQFDYVQQTLRAIALKYGAALFFTSHSRPTSFAKLRAYILHRLFAQPPSASNTAAPGSVAAPSLPAAPSSARAFPFPFRANVVDRDQVLVPTGWDSWGKIRILRDRYDADAVGKGWDLDMDRERNRLAGTTGNEEEEKLDAEGRRVVSAQRMYDEIVVDLDGDDQPINMANSRVEAQDEQDFLKTHYETLQKDREKDPRAAFAARPNAAGATQNGSETGYGASVVGPMASTSLSLPSVERALERDPDDVTARLAKMVRKDSSVGSRSPASPSFPSPPSGNGTSPLLNGSTSPGLTSALLSTSASPGGTPGGGQAQNEVLANFFQSLLSKRTTGPGGTNPGGVQSLTPSLGSSTSQGRAPTPTGGSGRAQ